MKLLKRVGIVPIIIVMAAGFAGAQTIIDGSVQPIEITASGSYQLQFPESDTLWVTNNRGLAADSALVDTARAYKAIIQMNADDVILDGNNQVIYGPNIVDGEWSDEYDVQGIWPNRIYADTTTLSAPQISNVTIMNTRTAVYLTKVGDAVVDGVTVIDAKRGVYVNSKKTLDASGVVVQNCTLINMDNEAITIRGPNHQVLNNTITADHALGTAEGITIQRSAAPTGGEGTTGILVSGNTINGASFVKVGIQADRSGTNTYTGNTVNNVLTYGLHFSGHASNGRSSDNTFTNTVISLTAVDSATGVYFQKIAENNLLDIISITNAEYAIVAEDHTWGNLIKNGTITGTLTSDVVVSGNSNVFLENTTFDTSGVMVEPGSAIFFGAGFTVDLDVTTPWDLPVAGLDVNVYNSIGHMVGVYTTDSDGQVSFKLAENGISADSVVVDGVDTVEVVVGNQNPYTFVVQSDELFASYNNEVTDSLYADGSVTIEMDIVWEPTIRLVTSEVYTLNIAEDTLMVNYLWAANSTDSAYYEQWIDNARTSKSIIEMSADNIEFDGKGKVIYGPGPDLDDYYDVQGIWPNRIYADTAEFNNIHIHDVTVKLVNNAIYVTKVHNGVIEDCRIEDVTRGIYVNGKANKDASGTIVQNNTLVNVYKEAITVRGGGTQILNNTITADRTLSTSGKRIGITIQRSIAEFTTGVLVQGNTIDGASYLGIGIRLDASGGNTYRDNVIREVTDYGLYFNSHKSRGFTEDNEVKLTTIQLAAADSAIGIYLTDASAFNLIDTVLVDQAGVAIKADDASRANVISNAFITNSVELDVQVLGGASVYLTTRTDIDETKVEVEEGSALFYGEPLVADVEVTLDGQAIPGLWVQVVNAGGDLVGTFETDADGMAYADVGTEGLTASGYSATQNPFTFQVIDTLDAGTSGLLGSVTVEITADTDVAIALDYLGVRGMAGAIPTAYGLEQNYPNPFNPSTAIRYALPENASVSLRVFDLTGRTIRTLVNTAQSAGYQTVVWDGRNSAGREVSTGLYFYELVAGDFRQTNKMMLLK